MGVDNILPNMVNNNKTTDRKTRTSIVLGNDKLPKKTSYQTSFNETYVKRPTKSKGHSLAEVFPSQVHPPPTEPLRRTIYREDFGRMNTKQTEFCHKEAKAKMLGIAGIHAQQSVPLAPHADVSGSKPVPSEQQTGYKEKSDIMKDWASIQKFADNEEVTPNDKPNKYEHLPTEHQRQYRWPVPDDIHVVTYQKSPAFTE